MGPGKEKLTNGSREQPWGPGAMPPTRPSTRMGSHPQATHTQWCPRGQRRHTTKARPRGCGPPRPRTCQVEDVPGGSAGEEALHVDGPLVVAPALLPGLQDGLLQVHHLHGCALWERRGLGAGPRGAQRGPEPGDRSPFSRLRSRPSGLVRRAPHPPAPLAQRLGTAMLAPASKPRADWTAGRRGACWEM